MLLASPGTAGGMERKCLQRLRVRHRRDTVPAPEQGRLRGLALSQHARALGQQPCQEGPCDLEVVRLSPLQQSSHTALSLHREPRRNHLGSTGQRRA